MAEALDSEHRRLLKANPLFAKLEEEVFANLTSSARLRAVSKGQLIFSPGDEAPDFFVVAHGGVRLFLLNRDGREATVNVFHRGQSFGEAAIFMESEYPVNAQATENSRLINIASGPIIERIKSDPQLALGLLASMSVHLKSLIDEITLLRTQNAAKRLAAFLLRLSNAKNGPTEFELPHNKTVLAKQLDVAPEVLSRALASLREHGVVISGRSVSLRDPNSLEHFVES